MYACYGFRNVLCVSVTSCTYHLVFDITRTMLQAKFVLPENKRKHHADLLFHYSDIALRYVRNMLMPLFYHGNVNEVLKHS